jgi:hypothetical protein
MRWGEEERDTQTRSRVQQSSRISTDQNVRHTYIQIDREREREREREINGLYTHPHKPDMYTHMYRKK